MDAFKGGHLHVHADREQWFKSYKTVQSVAGGLPEFRMVLDHITLGRVNVEDFIDYGRRQKVRRIARGSPGFQQQEHKGRYRDYNQ